MFLVVEGQDLLCSLLLLLLLFIYKVFLFYLHTPNFTIKRTLMKTFGGMPNEITPFLVTSFLISK